ncbi:hypothetical protein vseg_003855 [Gypsophila vaccaria]
MDVIEVITDPRKSTLLDEFERLSVEIQLNQAMLRRSLSEPGTSIFYQGRLGVIVPPPPLVRRPVEQGKRGSSWSLHRMLRKLIRPIFIRKKSTRNEDNNNNNGCHLPKERFEGFDKGRAQLKRFSKSTRFS